MYRSERAGASELGRPRPLPPRRDEGVELDLDEVLRADQRRADLPGATMAGGRGGGGARGPSRTARPTRSPRPPPRAPPTPSPRRRTSVLAGARPSKATPCARATASQSRSTSRT
jgi:hypothetical protein